MLHKNPVRPVFHDETGIRQHYLKVYRGRPTLLGQRIIPQHVQMRTKYPNGSPIGWLSSGVGPVATEAPIRGARTYITSPPNPF